LPLFSTHCGEPVAQDNNPPLQGLLAGTHELPAAQAPQAPFLQTIPLPQSVPLPTGWQIPVEHELQVPQLVWLQMPEMQFPFLHWLSLEQALPSATFGLQTPDAQKFPDTQSLSRVQLSLHADELPQISALGQARRAGVQTCKLSQAFLVNVDPAHESAPHEALFAT
jgi:hypothetical protein